MTVYTSAQINQLTSLSTTQILEHFGCPVVIQVVRSEKTNTPCIVFHSSSGILCNVLAKKHANVLTQMQSGWNPMVMNAAKDKEGEYFSVVPLKGLKPSTLRAWVSKARSAGFVVDDQVLTPTIREEVVQEEVAPNVDVVTEIPTEAPPVEAIPVTEEATEVTEVTPPPAPAPELNRIQVRVKNMTVKQLRAYLRERGEKTSGNKAVLKERVMASI